VRNIILSHEPLYALSEWARPYEPVQLGLEVGDVEVLNDDRVGCTLDRLFDADRASLLTELVVAMVREFNLDVSRLHNDSTTVTFHGDYASATGTERGGQVTPAITYGHNKDHRPDLLTELVVSISPGNRT
jgi:transposase